MKVETGEIQADRNSFLSKITNKPSADKRRFDTCVAKAQLISYSPATQWLVVGLTACLEMTFQSLSWLKRFPPQLMSYLCPELVPPSVYAANARLLLSEV